MKQTAVEWLIQNIVEDQTIKSKSMSEWIKIFDNAKEMEREQLIDFHIECMKKGLKLDGREWKELYFQKIKDIAVKEFYSTFKEIKL